MEIVRSPAKHGNAFGLCVLALFAVNFMRMNKYLALGAFCAGIRAFALFFQGSILPLYG